MTQNYRTRAVSFHTPLLGLLLLAFSTHTAQALECRVSSSPTQGPGDYKNCSDCFNQYYSLVPNASITASTFKPRYEPWNARVTEDDIVPLKDVEKTAWCPSNRVDLQTYEWLQIDYGEQKNFTILRLFGNFDDGDGTEFAPKFRLEFSRTVGGSMEPYIQEDGTQVLNGNTDARNFALRPLKPTLVARIIRVVPLADISITVCMRVEFSGCDVNTAVGSYTADPEAHEEPIEGKTYIEEKNPALYGPGKLADGLRYDSSVNGWPELHALVYMPTSDRTKLRLEFSLDNYRLVEQIHVMGFHRSDGTFRVFQEVRLYHKLFSNTTFPSQHTVKLDLANYTHLLGQTTYSIPLLNQSFTARFIKLELDFWEEAQTRYPLLVHEVKITSKNTVPPVMTPPAIVAATTTTGGPDIDTGGGTTSTKSPADPNNGLIETLAPIWAGADITQDAGKNGEPSLNLTFIGIIVGVCTGIILITALVVAACCVHQKRKKAAADSNRNSPDITHHTPGGTFTACPPGFKTYNNVPQSDSEKAESSVYDHPWARPLPHLPAYPPSASLQHPLQTMKQNGSSGYASDGPQYACIPVDGAMHFAAGGEFTSMHHGTPCMACYQKTLPPNHMQSLSATGMSNSPSHRQQNARTLPVNANAHNNRPYPANHSHPLSYASNDVTQLPPNSTHGGPSPAHAGPGGSGLPYDIIQPHPLVNGPSYHEEGVSPYDINNYRNNGGPVLPQLQGASGSSIYGTSESAVLQKSLQTQQIELTDISAQQLNFIELLGKGQHGEVHLARYTPALETSVERLVAVKTLVSHADDLARRDFHREIKIMSRLNHNNIIKVLGLCKQSESLWVVTEYMPLGDLHQFLQTCKAEGDNYSGDSNKRSLSRGCLIYFCTQVAEAMRYLEELNVTHRDLAARNCLVGGNYQLKIADFGMSRNLYETQYYKVEGQVVLPIRWMSWESVLLGRFTVKSDVWSYGVTLWEIFTFCREQPYSQLSDDEVIQNCMCFYHKRPSAEIITLHQPHSCPKEIYDLAEACWSPYEQTRPSFNEISLFLKRKNLGYNPLEEIQSTESIPRLTSI